MLAKLTSKNQLTLPKAMVEAVGRPSYFQIDFDGGRLILTPAKVASADAVRRKLEELGISDADVGEAVGWARRRR
jgi:preprotein translocase subunit SecF